MGTSVWLARIIFKKLIAFTELGKIQAWLVPGLNFAFWNLTEIMSCEFTNIQNLIGL